MWQFNNKWFCLRKLLILYYQLNIIEEITMSEEMRKYEENLGRFLPDLIKSYNEGSLIFL